MSRKIEDLEPDVQEMALEFLGRCKAAGYKVMITQTRRTFAEQQALYDQGRKTPGKKVTRASAGWSWHNYGLAFDFAEDDGTPYDIGKLGHDKDDEEWWDAIGAIGESVGLEWGGRWAKPDEPHFEHRSGNTLAVLRERARGEGALA